MSQLVYFSRLFSVRTLRSLVLLISTFYLLACAGMFDEPPAVNSVEKRKTLGEFYFEPVTLNHDPLPDQGLKTLRDAYVSLLDIVEDQETIKIVQYRLADLEVLLAEQLQEVGSAPMDRGVYDLAITQYQSILERHPEQKENAEVLYQLAKAHDLQGESQQSLQVIDRLLSKYPHTLYLAELQFRRGEILFNNKDYSAAIQAYQTVLEQGPYTDYFMTAAYMLGWSYFKVELYQDALLAFTQLLDQKLPNSVIDFQMLRQLNAEQQLEKLPVGEKRLVNDSIRIMALLFSYQGAEQSIKAFYQQVGERHYENLVYDRLGQQFLNEDRFRDSALVYRGFTDVHPEHNQAPVFAVKQIDAYIIGKFPTFVLPAKQDFVDQYGINGPFWQDWGQLIQEDVKPFLKAYIQELAQYEHSKAQLLTKAANQPTEEQLDKVDDNLQKAQIAYAQAASLYREFIETFPHDDLTPQITFNLAESLFEAQNYQQAITAYERYAYEYLNEPRAAEAGYAAILSFRALRETLTDVAAQQHWKDEQLASQQQFVSRFSDDPRAVDVQYDTMQQLFDLQRYLPAIKSAEVVLSWQPEVSEERKMAGQLVIAHSEFALQQYQRAELSYEQILAELNQDDPLYKDMLERLAASIYKQAEGNLAKQYVALAIEDFLRVIAKAPTSSARVNAQYDAATYLMELKQWPEAIGLLEDFRVRFAAHSLAENIQDKLIFAYQQNQNWLPAANELKQLWQANPDSEEGREALYIAAQYYLKAEQRDAALDSYRTYAHRYPLPFDQVTEARFQMSEFYAQSNEQAKRRFWLKKLIQGDEQASEARTDRSRYLAAMASMVFAEDDVQAFNRVKLSLPLNKSLTKKRQVLDKALDSLNATLEYKIAEFSTVANFKIGEIYGQLARDLMDSERPKGLSELELEQYNILLEEQAYPFEEQAIGIHEANIQRTWQGVYDRWVKESFDALRKLLPGRYNKQEQLSEATNAIF
ncbi:tetratricopeptide repeat protein [Aliiglaciecola sp. NS0011-25]|uniref:tetratricopeptide repeat protein n=1 Tax=Aliiglaciecola sp. NS0011-25 TaxID=3127654 RepID=UPI003109127C